MSQHSFAARLPLVGVMGSGTQPHPKRAKQLGEWLAGRAVHLLTGGGKGVMASVSQAFCSVIPRKGLSIGILPGDASGIAPDGYPNPWVEIPILTHLPLSGEDGLDPRSRNHLNILSSAVVVALPGGPGTSSEIRLALTYHRPLIVYADPAEIPDLPPDVVSTRDWANVKAFLDRYLP